jgi:hypothetical protein
VSGKARQRVRPETPEASKTIDRDLRILESLQLSLIRTWQALIDAVEKGTPRERTRAMVRLASVSSQLRAVTRDHARLARIQTQTAPERLTVRVKSGLSDKEIRAARKRLDEILEAHDGAGAPTTSAKGDEP